MASVPSFLLAAAAVAELRIQCVRSAPRKWMNCLKHGGRSVDGLSTTVVEFAGAPPMISRLLEAIVFASQHVVLCALLCQVIGMAAESGLVGAECSSACTGCSHGTVLSLQAFASARDANFVVLSCVSVSSRACLGNNRSGLGTPNFNQLRLFALTATTFLISPELWSLGGLGHKVLLVQSTVDSAPCFMARSAPLLAHKDARGSR